METMMNARLRVLALLATLPLTVAAGAGTPPTGKGTILSVDLGASRLVMAHETEGCHVYRLDGATRIVDEPGQPIMAADLRAGDYVRAEYVLEAQGVALAKQIRVLHQAWMETASPER
jgi:hypothetical protein